MKHFTMKLAMTTVIAGFMFGAGAVAQAQNWTQHVDWSATNTDAGGAVNCTAAYAQAGEWPAVLVGGRSTVINDALFAAYRGEVGRAFQLVLMTQCHNPGAQQELLQAGQSAVVGYLVNNWTPTGTDSQTIVQGVQTALYALAGN
jgi:hypothetical protein